MIVQSIKEMSQGHAHHAEREIYTKHIIIIVQSIIEEKGVKVMRFIRKRVKKRIKKEYMIGGHNVITVAGVKRGLRIFYICY